MHRSLAPSSYLPADASLRESTNYRKPARKRKIQEALTEENRANERERDRACERDPKKRKQKWRFLHDKTTSIIHIHPDEGGGNQKKRTGLLFPPFYSTPALHSDCRDWITAACRFSVETISSAVSCRLYTRPILVLSVQRLAVTCELAFRVYTSRACVKWSSASSSHMQPKKRTTTAGYKIKPTVTKIYRCMRHASENKGF